MDSMDERTQKQWRMISLVVDLNARPTLWFIVWLLLELRLPASFKMRSSWTRFYYAAVRFVPMQNHLRKQISEDSA